MLKFPTAAREAEVGADGGRTIEDGKIPKQFQLRMSSSSCSEWRAISVQNSARQNSPFLRLKQQRAYAGVRFSTPRCVVLLINFDPLGE
jgi:hypothetical protein